MSSESLAISDGRGSIYSWNFEVNQTEILERLFEGRRYIDHQLTSLSSARNTLFACSSSGFLTVFDLRDRQAVIRNQPRSPFYDFIPLLSFSPPSQFSFCALTSAIHAPKSFTIMTTTCVSFSWMLSLFAFYEVPLGASACYLRIAPWISSELSRPPHSQPPPPLPLPHKNATSKTSTTTTVVTSKTQHALSSILTNFLFPNTQMSSIVINFLFSYVFFSL
ncbi:hypothetical protein Pint_29013 [Pistacia integerrima]|uniref:Uncharacterized protein n=1 Tax=Pistacia integerrima TaxID=434235 RepID=A0ACC0X0K0_9ROSI|nr:hypothetical protein Pint_29013 [Pistacia integerrima]